MNSDGQPYYGSTLGEQLRNVLRRRPPYYLGMRYPDQRELQLGIPQWIQSQRLQDLTWYDAGLVWWTLSAERRINELFEALQPHSLIVVGPPHLRRLERWINYRAFIEVPHQNAWKDRQRIEQETFAAFRPGTVVILCCGMTANVLLDKLYLAFQDTGFFIDFGSVFDPYCGMRSRRYHMQSAFRAMVQRFIDS